MNQQLRDPSELVGALLVEATAIPHDTTTQQAVAHAVEVHDAIAIPSHNSTLVSNDNSEREIANIATQRGRQAAAAEIAAIRDSNRQQQHQPATAAVREIPTKADVDELQYAKNETGNNQAAVAKLQEPKGCFGSGGYEVQEYDTTNYDVAEYSTKEYKSVYDD